MDQSPILRFPIAGATDQFFLVQVTKSKHGSKPLDLLLVGSEGAEPYAVKIRHNRIGELKDPNSHCTEEEWETILRAALTEQTQAADIEIKAEVDEGKATTLQFRRNIQGITQRLGQIKLTYDSEQEISPFDWCVQVITSREKVVQSLADAEAKASTLEESVTELKAQLDELIKAKDADETQLLEKFRDLLNEKKVKIRQQQRLLASAKVEPEKLANVGGSQSAVERQAKGSSRSKRKADEEADEESEDGFDEMDVDDGPKGGAQLDPEPYNAETPDENTPSEDSDGDEVPVRPARKAPAAKEKPGSTRATRGAASKGKATIKKEASSDEDEGNAPPPPRRDLPFARSKPQPASETAQNDETDSDDEL